MMFRNSFRQLAGLLACIAAGAAVGCSRGPELATVSGVVTRGGLPLDEIRVEFMPDPEAGNKAQMSAAETDSEGRFSLVYQGKGNPPGAAVGQHRVVLWDYKSINSRDNPIPSRIGEQFNNARSTPIRMEVRRGDQVIDLELDKF